ncbi:MAG TPA: hypothetical protein PLY93_10265, partial [Turneriella sp.]|nr:hypothetical protein [Turneriella sp.]
TTALFADTHNAGRFGAEFSYGDTIGVLRRSNQRPAYVSVPTLALWYHFTDSIAVNLRAGLYMTTFVREFSYGICEYSICELPPTKNELTSYAFSIEIPFYIAQLNAVRLYLAPSAGYNYMQTEMFYFSAASSVPEAQFKYLSEQYSVSATLGVQVALLEQLHILGRTTFGYIWTGQPPTSFINTPNQQFYLGFQSWSLGAIVYFN